MRRQNFLRLYYCAIFVVFYLLGCSPKEARSEQTSSTEERKLRIGYSSYSQRGPYFSAVVQSIKNKSQKNDWSFISTDAENRAEKQLSDVEDMLSRGIDYLILNPKDEDSGVRITRSAVKKNVPVITIDSGISSEAPVITRVLSPNFDSNFETGRYVASEFGKKEIVVGMVDGEKGNIVTTQRRNGFILGLTDRQLENIGSTNFKIKALLYTAWDAEGGVRGAEDLLSAYPNINVIYVTTDDMARGAIRYLKSQGKLSDIKVVGFDGSNEGINIVAAGEYFATALNSPRLMVDKVFETIKKYEQGIRAFPSEISYKPVVITQENASMLKDQGF